MKRMVRSLLVVFCSPVLVLFAAYGDDIAAKKSTHQTRNVLRTEICSIKNDIAFVSVWGSRPDARKLQGFQHAVLFNARGEVVSKVDIGRDSIYSLDKMIQENKTRGPLFIRMYRK